MGRFAPFALLSAIAGGFLLMIVHLEVFVGLNGGLTSGGDRAIEALLAVAWLGLVYVMARVLSKPMAAQPVWLRALFGVLASLFWCGVFGLGLALKH